MAARGTIAKTNVENKIKEIFGTDFAGISDKKLYIWADDGGERVQIAITMTCPKTNINFDGEPVSNNYGSFVEGNYSSTPVVEFTKQEEETIDMLIKRLGL